MQYIPKPTKEDLELYSKQTWIMMLFMLVLWFAIIYGENTTPRILYVQDNIIFFSIMAAMVIFITCTLTSWCCICDILKIQKMHREHPDWIIRWWGR